LARVLEINAEPSLTNQGLVETGNLNVPQTLDQFSRFIESKLKRAPLVIGDLNRLVQNVAWCTGAAQGYIEEAIALGVDVFISGEISEQTVHLSRESGVAYIAAGHHATERYGVKALGEHLASHFDLDHEFIDIDNPV